MTDAVREYRDACRAPACSIDREAFNWNRATALLRGRDYLAKYADAAIAELEAKVEELDDKLMEAEGAHENARRWFEEQKKQFARAEKAEAERDQALFVADGWHRQFKRAAKARREEKARAKKATEYARIEVKRKNEAVEREAAAIERAEAAEAEAERLRSWQADGEPDMVRVQRERAEKAEAELAEQRELNAIYRGVDRDNLSLAEDLEKADKRFREERRLRQAADSALVQALRHPNSKLDHVADYLFRLERSTAAYKEDADD